MLISWVMQAVAFWDFWSLFMDGFLDNMFALTFFDLGAYNDMACGISTYLDWATSRAAILAVAISACDRCLSGELALCDVIVLRVCSVFEATVALPRSMASSLLALPRSCRDLDKRSMYHDLP